MSHLAPAFHTSSAISGKEAYLHREAQEIICKHSLLISLQGRCIVFPTRNLKGKCVSHSCSHFPNFHIISKLLLRQCLTYTSGVNLLTLNRKQKLGSCKILLSQSKDRSGNLTIVCSMGRSTDKQCGISHRESTNWK